MAVGDGARHILDIQPTQLHKRVSLCMGSTNEVGCVTSFDAKATGQARSPSYNLALTKPV